jgi:hypothetical protein
MISVPDGVERVAMAGGGNQHAAPLLKLIRRSNPSPDILRNDMRTCQKSV